LKQFKKREGHCNVPQSHTEDGIKLGLWVANQRRSNRKETLSPDRQKILEEIGLHWEIRSATWENMYVLLKKFKKREGHCDVPVLHTEDGIKLGTVLLRQRDLKKAGKLDPHRQKILDEIGIDWVRDGKRLWEPMFSQLERFKKREGHCNVPRSHTEDGMKLGTWVGNQRAYKKSGLLNPDRQKRLDEIGIEWFRHAEMAKLPWEQMFSLLERFKKCEGHCDVPPGETEDGINLRRWMVNQRQLKKNGKLDPDREKRLEEIGFEWVLTLATWDEMYALLKQFKKREGHYKVPKFHREGRADLGRWVKSQRYLTKTGTLNPHRQKLLDEISIELVGRKNRVWEESFSVLKQFKKREGHCDVPPGKTEDGGRLRIWVLLQRRLKATQKLNPNNEKQLEEIGFVWVLPAST
jgi:hypothetical protein